MKLGFSADVHAQVLTALQGLRSLAVNRCPRIGDKGLLIVQRLSHLTSLNCYGCVKVRFTVPPEVDVHMPPRYVLKLPLSTHRERLV